jgi:hypothetical protein
MASSDSHFEKFTKKDQHKKKNVQHLDKFRQARQQKQSQRDEKFEKQG